MPSNEEGEHALQLALPPGLQGDTDVWVVRFTGETFTEYEAYLQHLNKYRQRVWSCKYTGASGLTYEEAVLSEQRVGKVVEQFPKLFEASAIRLVHHSVETAEQLCSSILAHLGAHFVQGEELVGTRDDGSTASCVVLEVQEPQRQPRGGAAAATAKENGAAAGEDSEATEDDEKEAAVAAAEEEEDEEEEQPADPDAIVYVVEWLGEGAPGGERASLRRGQLRRAEGSPLAALTGPFLQLWVETVATAEPVAGVAGISCLWRVAEYWRQLYGLPEQLPAEMAERLRPARQKALHKVPSALQQAGAGSDEEPGAGGGGGGEDDEEAEYDPDEVEAELYHEAAAASDFSDDEYRPRQPGMAAQFKPMPARGRGRGRGRGRWGGRGGGAYGSGADASYASNPAAAAFAAAAVAAASGSLAGQPGSAGLATAGSISGSGPGDGQQALLDHQHQLELRQRLAEAAAKPKSDRNNFKCPKCHRVAHAEGSPLLLCDTCPRSFHRACLGLAPAELPTGDWCCPKCVGSTQAALRRVVDLESRRREAGERAAQREKAAEEKLMKRMAQKEERRKPDDFDVLEEEKENVHRLEIRLRELQELAARVQQQQEQAAGPGGPQPGQLSYSIAEQEDLQMRVAEAAEALAKLQVIVQGPPGGQELVSGEHAQAVLWQGLIATEFLKLYGDACEARIMGLQELYISLAWPLDNPELARLLQQMLLCCLLELQNHEPPERSRAKRWTRILSEGTWPEICRRYLLSTRAGKAAAGSPASGAAAEDVIGMDEDQAALHLAHLLESTPWHGLPSTALLRLLNILCYDIAQGYALRNDINARLQNITKITTERYREHAAERKAKREGGDWGPVFGGGKKRKGSFGGGGGRKGGGGGGAAGKNAEPTEEELQAMAEEVEAEAMEEDGDDDAARFRMQRELQYDARLDETAMRTEPLGLDRHCRRYWWLYCDPGFLFVEEPDGQRIGVITSKEQLDEVLSRLNRRGPRERQLHHNLRKKYSLICSRLTGQPRMEYRMEAIPRPAPLIPGQAQPAVEELAAQVASSAVQETKDKLAAFLEETQKVGVELEVEGGSASALQGMRGQLAACGDAPALCSFLLQLETVYCHAGEGLPRDADDTTMAALLGELGRPAGIKSEEQDDAQGGNNNAAAAEAVKQEGGQEAAAAGDAMDVDAAAAGGDDQQTAAAAAGGEEQQGGLRASGSSAVLCKEEPQAEGRQAGAGAAGRRQSVAQDQAGAPGSAGAQKPPLHPAVAKLAKQDSMQPSSAGVSQSGAEDGATETEAGTTVDQAAQPLRPVSANDDMDDSDAEHTFLREKRMRRPARLWRSARERAVWLRMVRGAQSAEQAAYCAFILCDRAGPMLARVVQLAEEIAKWEAEEKERARLDGLKAKRAEGLGPSQRPLMIRTGKAKTDDGVRIVLKAMGKEPFASGRGTTNIETVATEEQVAECRWGYQCSVCLLAGDLLCCEHPDVCGVSVHLECTGMAFPTAAYICMNHDSRELKTRIRRRASSALAAQDSGDESTEDEDGEEGGGKEDGSGKEGGEGGSKAAGAADSDATISEETKSLDSDATEDEGTSSRKRRRK